MPRLNNLDLSQNLLGAPVLTELENVLLLPSTLALPTHNLRVLSLKSK